MRSYDEINVEAERAKGLGDSETLFRLSKELLELGTPEAVAQAHNSLGTAELLVGNLPAGYEHFKIALGMYEELEDRVNVAGVNGNIGNVYGMSGDFPAALECYLKTLDNFEELGDPRGLSLVCGNIGRVYAQVGDYPAALEHLNRSLDIAEENQSASTMAMALTNMGHVFSQMGDYPVALEHLYRGLDAFKEISGEEVSNTTSVIIHVLLLMNRLDEAIALLDEEDNKAIPLPGIQCDHLSNRAKALELSDDLEAAHSKYLEALEIARDTGSRKQQSEIHMRVRDLAQKRNDFAAYIEHNNEFTRLTEEINGKDAATKLAMQSKQREIDAREREHEKQIAVLHSTLPKHIADRVARGEVVNDHFDDAAVMFLDIVGFTTISSKLPAGHVVHLLESIFKVCDEACVKHSITKIKTIGDSYMAVGFESPTDTAAAALTIMKDLARLEVTMPPEMGDTSWTKDIGDIEVRIGLHRGPVVAGVIGSERMQYDVWGDTVNIASRMESSGEAGRIHVSEEFAASIPHPVTSGDIPLHLGEGAIRTIERGTIDVKGKGKMKTFWLEGA